MKVIRANALINWFLDEFDFQVIYLVRHPIAQAHSCISRNYHSELDEYIGNKYFIRENLSSEHLSFIHTVRRGGTVLEKFVTEWCLDNIIPLRTHRNRSEDFLTITYEEMVARTDTMIDLLWESLDLPSRELMAAHANLPSRVTDSLSRKTRKRIKSGVSHFLIRKWKQDISFKEGKRLFEICDCFDIDAYPKGRLFADERFLHFM